MSELFIRTQCCRTYQLRKEWKKRAASLAWRAFPHFTYRLPDMWEASRIRELIVKLMRIGA
jgi:hypothetical protein